MKEYLARGRLPGEANLILNEELNKALQDSNHELRPVVEALQRGDSKHASTLLTSIYAHALENESSPLHLPAFVFFNIVVAQMAQPIADELTKTYNFEALKDFPVQMIQWAAQPQLHAEKSSKGGQVAGKAKRKQAESTHQKIENAAKRLVDSGTDKRELASSLGNMFDLSAKQIRTILQTAKILEKRKRK